MDSFVPMKLYRSLLALLISASLLETLQAVPDFPKTPKGQVPLLPDGGVSGIYRVMGDYAALPGSTAGEGWRYTGFQSVLVTHNTSAWRFDWSFELPAKSDTGFWAPASYAQRFETGFSSRWPLPEGSVGYPYVNSYVQDINTGALFCYHIPVPSHILSDYLKTAVPTNGTENIASKWIVGLGGNRAKLLAGWFRNKKVRLYKNTDRWFQCPRCSLITAVSESSGKILRHFFIQPTIDFYTDYWEFSQFNGDAQYFKQGFKYTSAYKNTTCRNIATGELQHWDENGPLS